MLSPDLKDELARIDLSGLGIFSLRPDRWEAGSDKPRRIKAEMYVETMAFKLG